MRKIVVIVFCAAVFAVVIALYARQTTQQQIIQRSLSSEMLGLFSEETKTLTSAQIRLEKARVETELLKLAAQDAQTRAHIEAVPVWESLRRQAFAWGLTLLAALLSIAGVTAAVVFLWRAAFVLQQIGGSQVWVSRRFLRSAPGALWLAGVVQIESLRAQSPEKALELTAQHLRALRGMMSHKEHSRMIDVTPNGAQAAALPEKPVTVPTFRELLESGAIGKGKMILGYEEGIARVGSFLDIYSAAVAGESGSGKTKTMLYLIGSGLVAYQARFIGIDPHYPHPGGLAMQTKALWQRGLMSMATSKDDMLAALDRVEKAIEARLDKWHEGMPPVILVIDELLFLSKMRFASRLFAVMERISTEGRKAGVYMLASSQAWQAKRLGNDSIVRDTLTSAYVHRIKPKQAGMILQDRGEVDKVRSLTQPGDVLLCTVNDESSICRIPYTVPADMELIAAKMSRVTAPKTSKVSAEQRPEQTPELPDSAGLRTTPHIDSEAVKIDLQTTIQTEVSQGKFPSKTKWLEAFSARINVKFGTLDKMTRDISAAGPELWRRVAEGLIAWRAK